MCWVCASLVSSRSVWISACTGIVAADGSGTPDATSAPGRVFPRRRVPRSARPAVQGWLRRTCAWRRRESTHALVPVRAAQSRPPLSPPLQGDEEACLRATRPRDNERPKVVPKGVGLVLVPSRRRSRLPPLYNSGRSWRGVPRRRLAKLKCHLAGAISIGRQATLACSFRRFDSQPATFITPCWIR